MTVPSKRLMYEFQPPAREPSSNTGGSLEGVIERHIMWYIPDEKLLLDFKHVRKPSDPSPDPIDVAQDRGAVVYRGEEAERRYNEAQIDACQRGEDIDLPDNFANWIRRYDTGQQ